MTSHRNPVVRTLATLRAYLAVAFVVVSLLCSDLVQRTVVAALVRLFPRSKNRILTSWIQMMRAIVLDITIGVIAGGELEATPRLPGRAGVLVIMNHQSLLDIPLVVKAIEPGFPRIVTRRRYGRGIPVISHLTRLYQYPVVDPEATGRGDVEGLREAAVSGDMPLVIFPEGTRTRTGEIGRWRRGGLRRLLQARSWDVYVVVVDGVWQSRRFADFVRHASSIRCRMASAGPFPSPAPGEDVERFIDRMRACMEDTLHGVRTLTP